MFSRLLVLGSLAAVLVVNACAGPEDDASSGQDSDVTGSSPANGVTIANRGTSSDGGSGDPAADVDAASADAASSSAPGKGSSACGKAGAPTGAITGQKISVKGAGRSYDLFVGSAYNGKTPLPLVFVFSGAGGTGAQIRASYPIEGQAGGKAIFVYPNARIGSGAPPNSWDLDSVAAQNQDILLFDALRAQLAATYCVDTTRVFAAGMSAGAYFANQLGCRRGAELRATAAHSGGGPFGSDSEYDGNGNLVCPEKPAGGALVIHGLADGTVAPSEGAASLAYWRAADKCAAGNGASYAPSPCLALSCATGHPVVHCEIPGLGHDVWKSAAQATWKFFTQF